MNWPNRITLFRIFLIPVFLFFVTAMDRNPLARYVAIVIFALMALSDAIDGFLARRLKSVTVFGKLVDPVADKLLMAASYWIMASFRFFEKPLIPFWLAFVVIGRDIFIAAGFAIIYLKTGTKDVKPSRVGKASTVFQLSAIIGVLLGTLLPDVFIQAIFIVVVLFTVTSWAQYTWIGTKILESFEKAKQGHDRHAG